MKKLFICVMVGCLLAFAFAFITGVLNISEDILDDETTEETESDSAVVTAGTSASTTTVIIYLPDGSMLKETSTAISPSVSTLVMSGYNIVDFCNKTIYSTSSTITGLSLTDDGDVVESEGDIPFSSGMTLTCGGTYVYYLVISEDSPSVVTTQSTVTTNTVPAGCEHLSLTYEYNYDDGGMHDVSCIVCGEYLRTDVCDGSPCSVCGGSE